MGFYHNITAENALRLNLISGGGFTGIKDSVKEVENTLPLRATVTATRKDAINTALYGPVSYSFTTPSVKPADNQLGHWHVYGTLSTVEISPIDSKDFVISSRDGGNVARIVFEESGTITFEQPLMDLQALEGNDFGIAFSGIHFDGDVCVKMLVEYDGGSSELVGQSLLFGTYRRLIGEGTFPAALTSATVKLEISGSRGDAVGLSGVMMGLGACGRSLPYTESMVDRVIPKGAVIMVTGTSCPSGYAQATDGENRLALIGSTRFQPTQMFGSDEHDHLDSTVDGTTASDSMTTTDLPISPGDLTLMRVVDFHNYPAGGLNGNPTIPFTPYDDEQPGRAVSNTHNHQIGTKMTAVPPSFQIRFCEKL